MAPKQARNIDGIVAVQCQQCWKRAVQCQQYCHDCWDAWGHYVVLDPPAEAGARMPPSAEAGPKKKAKMQAAKLKSLQPKGAQDADPPAEVASGSGGPYGIEVKGSGERPLAEAAALEIDPERLTESHHHTTLRLNVDPIATAVSHAHTMSHSLAFPSLIEAFHIFWLYQLPLQAAAWGQLHRCFQG